LAPVFLFILNLIAGKWVLNTADKHPKRFVGIYLGSVFLRMLLSLFLIVIFLIVSEINKIPWVLSFILCYFLFTVFEIRIILVNLRPEIKKEQDNENDRK
jgi:uncharacterized membrane protein